MYKKKKRLLKCIHVCLYVCNCQFSASFDLCIWSEISSLLFKNLFVVLLSVKAIITSESWQ